MVRKFTTFIFIGLLWQSFAMAAPSKFAYQGQIIKPNGQPLEGNSVTFTIEIVSPGAEECNLYRETHTINMSGSNGIFALTVGEGSQSGTDYEDTGTLVNALDNNTGLVTPTNCLGGANYTPVATDGRRIRVTFDDGSGPNTLSGYHNVVSVPYADSASSIDGLSSSDLIQSNTGGSYVLTQANVENIFDSANHTELLALIGGTSTQYLTSTPAADFSMNSNKITDLANPTLGTDATNKNYVDGNIGGIAADTATISALTVGDAGDVLVWNGSQWTSGPAGDATKLPLDGSSAMTGDLDMGGNSIGNAANAVLSNDLSVGNNAIVSGDLTVSNDGTVTNDLSVGNNALISNDLSVTNDVSVSGGIGVATGITSAGRIQLDTANEVRFMDGADTNFVALRGPAVAGASVTYDLPVNDGSNGDVLSTSGSGVMSWVSNDQVDRAGDAMDGNLMMNNESEVRFGDNDNDRYVGFKAPAVISAPGSFVWELPADDGTAAQVLQTDGSGILSWVDQSSVTGSALTDSNIWVGDGSNQAAQVSMSGDASLANTGVLTINANAIDTAKIADDAVETINILDSNVTNAKLADNSVDTAKLADDAVETVNILDSNVTSSKIADGNVVNSKLADNAVDTAKLADNAVATINIQDNAVTSAKIADDEIVDADINSIADIDATKLGTGIVDNTEFNYLNGLSSGIQSQLNNKATLGGDAGAVVLGSDDSTLSLEANNAVAVTIDSAGNVGVGISTPGSPLHIRNSAEETGRFESTDNISRVTVRDNSDTFNISLDGASGFAELSFNTSFGTGLGIDSSGNVGIGSTTPTSLLDVAGTIRVANGGESCSGGSNTGMIRYNGGDLDYCNGASWQTLGISGAGITNFNGETGGTQSLALDGNGTAPVWNSASNTHTLSIPLASGAGVTSGTISKTDYDEFNQKLDPDLNDGDLFVGSAGNAAVGVTMSGDATMINTGAITISNNAVNNAKLADNAVVSINILDGEVATADLADNAVDNAKLDDDAVATVNIQDDAVTSAKIADDEIVNADINSGANIDATKLGTGIVDNTEFNYLNGASSNIQTQLDGKVDDTGDTMTGNLTMNTESEVRFSDNDNDRYVGFKAPAAITAAASFVWELPVDDGTSGQVLRTDGSGILSWVDTSVGGSSLTDGNIWVGDGSNQATERTISGDATMTNAGVLTVAANAIDTGKLADDAVETINILDDNVTNAKLADNSVDTVKLANDAVETANILNANVTNAKLADNSVDSAKLANDAVATINILDNAVTSAKILDDEIVDADINSGANIDATKLGTGIVDNTEFNYLNGLSSDIQSQLDNKATLGGDAGAVVLGSNDDTLSLEANNTVAVTVDSSGNVGIGTTVPNQALTVRAVGGSGRMGISTYADNLGNNINDSQNLARFYAGNGASGANNMGLLISNERTLTNGSDSWNNSRLSLSHQTSTTSFSSINFEVGASTNSGFITINGNGTEIMRLDGDTGVVGIGSTAPTSLLDVAGTIRIDDGGETCTGGNNTGMIRYNGGNLDYCNGTAWQTLGVSGAGLTNFNGETGSTQSLAIDANGLAPAWNSTGNVHTLSIPLASTASVTSGTISKADYDEFNQKLDPDLNDGDLFVGSAGNAAVGVTMSGDATMINTGAITIADNAINSAKLANNAVQTVNILDQNITTNKLANDAVDSSKLADNAVTTNKILDGTIVDADVNASADIDATKLGTGIVDNTEFNYLNGVSSGIQSQIDGKVDLAGDNMTGNLNIDNGNQLRLSETDVGGSNYVGFRAPADMSNASVTWELPDGDGTTGQFLQTDGSGVLTWQDVTTSIVGSTLTDGSFWMGDGSNQAAEVSLSGDATMTNAGVVTIADNAVDNAKLADNAVDTINILDGAVDSAKINNNSIVNADINTSAGIAATKIATGSVTNAEFNYLNGVTSSIQGQLDNKATLGGDNGAIVLGSNDNTLSLEANDSVAMTIDSSGNIGVGTTTPSATIHIQNSTGPSTLFMGDNDSGRSMTLLGDNVPSINTTGIWLTLDTVENGVQIGPNTGGGTNSRMTLNGKGSFNSYFSISSDNDNFNEGNIFYVNGTGAVGIGSQSPSAKLDVVGDAAISSNLDLDGSLIMPSDGSGDLRWGGSRIQGISGDNDLLFFTNASERMRLNDGRLGIGTTTPVVSLDISGTDAIVVPQGTDAQRPAGENGMIRYNSDNSKMEVYENGGWANLFTGTGAAGDLINGGNSGAVTVGSNDNSLSLESNGVDAISIDTNQNSTFSGVIQLPDGSASNPSLTFSSDSNTGIYNVTSEQIGFTTNGTKRFEINQGAFEGRESGAPRINSSAGDETTAGYHFVNDADTGLFRPAANELAFTNSGSESFRINSSGNVGVGTTTPQFETHIHDSATGSGTESALLITTGDTGSASNDGLQLGLHNDGSSTYALLLNHEASDLRLGTSSGVDMTISSSGDVGIGTTTPDQNLHVIGNMMVEDSGATKGYRFRTSGGALDFEGSNARMVHSVWSGSDFSGTQRNYLVMGNISHTAAARGSWSFLDGNATDTSTGNTILKVDATSGFVGIGTTTPVATLDVSGTDAIVVPQGTDAQRPAGENGMIRYNSDNSKMEVYEAGGWADLATGSIASSGLIDGGNDGAIVVGSNDNTLSLEANDSVAITIDSAGSVGIGTTAPSAKLDVVSSGSLGNWGGFNTSNATLQLYDGANSIYMDGNSLLSTNQLLIGTTTNQEIQFGTNDSERMRITSSGNVGIGTTSPSLSLDISATDAIRIPAGTTAQRPAQAEGMLRYNTDTGSLEVANSDVFFPLLSPSQGAIINGGNSLFGDITIGTNDNYALNIETNNSTAMTIDNSGNVGVGSTAPRATLDVNGSIASGPAVTEAGGNIDFAGSNFAYTASDCGAFNLYSMKDGATYTMAVQGVGLGTCAFTAYPGNPGSPGTALTVKLPPSHGATTGGTETLYSFVVIGTTVYVAWVPGY